MESPVPVALGNGDMVGRPSLDFVCDRRLTEAKLTLKIVVLDTRFMAQMTLSGLFWGCEQNTNLLGQRSSA